MVFAEEPGEQRAKEKQPRKKKKKETRRDGTSRVANPFGDFPTLEEKLLDDVLPQESLSSVLRCLDVSPPTHVDTVGSILSAVRPADEEVPQTSGTPGRREKTERTRKKGRQDKKTFSIKEKK